MKHREPLEDWEAALHRELDALPDLEAPSTLIPAVMNRIQAKAPSSQSRASWGQWPLSLRIASVVAVSVVLAGLGWVSGAFGELELGRQVALAFTELKAALASVMGRVETVAGSGAEFWRQHGQILLLTGASLLFVTYLMCVAAGSALYQLAWRKSV